MNLQSLLRCEPQRVVPPKTALEEIEEQRIIAAAKLRQVSTMIGGPKTLHDRSTTGEKAVHVIRLGMAPHCVVPHCRWTHPSKALLRRVPLYCVAARQAQAACEVRAHAWKQVLSTAGSDARQAAELQALRTATRT